MVIATLLGISVLVNALLLRAFIGWKANAYQAADAAQEQHLMLDLAFYMLTKRAGLSEDEKPALMETIHRLAPLPAPVKVQMADALPFLTQKNERRIGFGD